MALPVRGHLDKGDFYFGRGCRQRGLRRSLYANDYKVLSAVRPQLSGSLRSSLWAPNFTKISTLSLERDCFATAGRRKHATLIRSSQLSATSSPKPSIEMMRKLQPRLPVFSIT